MSDYDGNVVFKEWLPDQPDLNNPGLIEALNVLPVDGTYASYSPLAGTGTALPGLPCGAVLTNFGGSRRVYALGSTTAGAMKYYEYDPVGPWISRSATLNGTFFGLGTQFVQFDDLVIGTDWSNGAYALTVGSNTTFNAVSIGAAPDRIGVINRFVVVGRFPTGATQNSQSIRWSAIDSPLSWPVPGSDTAIATQAGDQFFDPACGQISAITGGDQFGLIFQTGAVNRMTYVGPPVVFQFDRLSDKVGAYFPNAVVSVLPLVYFMSGSGFFVTDGVTIKEIGKDKVSRTIYRDFSQSATFDALGRVYGAYDGTRKLIYWAYRSASASTLSDDKIIVYNVAEDRFSRATDSVYTLFTGLYTSSTVYPNEGPPYGFQSAFTLGSFSGAPGSAVLTTGETEPNPGGFTRIGGIKPLVDVTANAVTAALGTRNDRSSSVTFTSEITANARSGMCDFRSEARYHRARLTIAGTFNAAQGLEYRSTPSGFT